MTNKDRALLAPVDPTWLNQAFDLFKTNHRKEICFYTDSHLGESAHERSERVYFKVTGSPNIVARARCMRISTENSPEKRLPGNEHREGKYYYEFRELTWIPHIPLSSLRYFKTKNRVPNDLAGATIIEDLSESEIFS
jgi:hypothetical protein